jgi:hypothetical protein
MKRLMLGAMILLGAWIAVEATQVGPDEVVEVSLPLFAIEDEQDEGPVIARGRIAFPSGCSHCQIHRTQYRLVVPEGTLHLIVQLENLDDSDGDIDLLLSSGAPNSEDESTVYADYVSQGYGGREEIVLPLDTEDALPSGVYYAGVMSLVGEGAQFELRAFAYVRSDVLSPTTTASVDGFATYCDPAAGFSIEHPADWISVSPSELLEDEIVGFKTAVTTVGDRAIFKVTRSSPVGVESVQEGYEQLRAMMEAEPGYVFLDKSDLTIDGVRAVKYTFQRQYELGPATVVFTYWIHDDAEWAITFACTPVSSYTSYAETLNRLLSSFRLVGSCARATETARPVASTVVTSGTAGTVSDGSGARIDVPIGAVPMNLSGGEGEMLFTVERGTAQRYGLSTAPPAAGMVATSVVYDLGPSGFVFARPVRIALPLPADFNPATHVPLVCRFDTETGEWVVIGGLIDETGTSVSVDVARFSFFSIYLNPMSERAFGALELSRVPGYSATLCVDTYSLKYPEVDRYWAARRWRELKPVCWVPAADATGTDKVRWLLPQGTYRIGVNVWGSLCSLGTCELIGHYYADVDIDAPSSYPDYFAIPLSWKQTVDFPGEATCSPRETPAVGVGDLNVRLDWNARCDLDLWVIDPTGEKIFYGNTVASSGGTLDQDNRCGDFVLGRPENVYWPSGPPRGTYKVYVDYYSDCEGVGAVSYKVTWFVNGVADSRSGTIVAPAAYGQDDDEVLVVEFTY